MDNMSSESGEGAVCARIFQNVVERHFATLGMIVGPPPQEVIPVDARVQVRLEKLATDMRFRFSAILRCINLWSCGPSIRDPFIRHF